MISKAFFNDMAQLVLPRFILAVMVIGAGACSASPPSALTDPAANEKAAFRSHLVEPGDTLSALAARYGVLVGALAAANGLGPPYTIYVGQRLDLPSAAADRVQTYVMQPGDTMSGIAARFGTTVNALAAASNISDPDNVRTGQVVVVVPAELAPRSARPRPGPRVSTGPALLLPVRGEVVVGFAEAGGGLELAAEPGAPVHAAADGVVAYAGPGPGRTAVVLLRHGDGGIGVYARAGEVLVTRGDHVRRGAVIARLPNQPGSRLRFELRQDGQKVDPTARLVEEWPEDSDGLADKLQVGSPAEEAQAGVGS